MAAEQPSTTEQAEREIVITRVFKAPRKLVWEAFTEKEHLEQWWGPEHFTTRVEKHDFRPGGRFRYVMVGPDGKEYPAEGEFVEIVEYERIVGTDQFGDDVGLPPEVELPKGKIVTTTVFEDEGENTRVTLRILHETVKDRDLHEKMGVVPGWSTSLDCLERHLASVLSK